MIGTGAALTAPSLAGATQEYLGRWTPRTDMPFAAQEIYPAEFRCGGEPVIVVAGGITAGVGGKLGVTDQCAFYVAVADIWNMGATLPAPRHHLALASAGGALFAIGGFAADEQGQWRMQRDVWRIDDLNREKWRTVAPLPIPQAEAVTLSDDGLIHLIGGRTPKGERNQDWQDQADTGAHWVYDAKEDNWSARAPLPSPRNSAAGAVYGGELFVLSGRTVTSGNWPVCHAYDPKADRWREIAPMPNPTKGAPSGRGGHAAAVVKDRGICVFGGEWFGDRSGVYDINLVYDPARNRWTGYAPEMPRPRHGLGAVSLGGSIYTIGGATGAGAVGTCAFVDRFDRTQQG